MTYVPHSRRYSGRRTLRTTGQKPVEHLINKEEAPRMVASKAAKEGPLSIFKRYSRELFGRACKGIAKTANVVRDVLAFAGLTLITSSFLISHYNITAEDAKAWRNNNPNCATMLDAAGTFVVTGVKVITREARNLANTVGDAYNRYQYEKMFTPEDREVLAFLRKGLGQEIIDPVTGKKRLVSGQDRKIYLLPRSYGAIPQ